jgi:phosphoglycolate phosphatase
MKYDIVMFDLDGTILDTLEDLTDSLNAVFKTKGYKERTIEEVRSFVGNGVFKLIERAVPVGTSHDDIYKTFMTFSEYYQKHCSIKTKPYEGIKEVIETLKNYGCMVVVISNKIDEAVVSLCKQHFGSLIDIAVGDKIGIPRKPNPAMVEFILERTGISNKKAIYIGDSEVDIETAKNAHMDGISVSWGFKDYDFLVNAGATTIVSKPSELIDLILK